MGIVASGTVALQCRCNQVAVGFVGSIGQGRRRPATAARKSRDESNRSNELNSFSRIESSPAPDPSLRRRPSSPVHPSNHPSNHPLYPFRSIQSLREGQEREQAPSLQRTRRRSRISSQEAPLFSTQTNRITIISVMTSVATMTKDFSIHSSDVCQQSFSLPLFGGETLSAPGADPSDFRSPSSRSRHSSDRRCSTRTTSTGSRPRPSRDRGSSCRTPRRNNRPTSPSAPRLKRPSAGDSPSRTQSLRKRSSRSSRLRSSPVRRAAESELKLDRVQNRFCTKDVSSLSRAPRSNLGKTRDSGVMHTHALLSIVTFGSGFSIFFSPFRPVKSR